jgi:hypothetical protein
VKNFQFYAPTRVFFGKGEYVRTGEILAGYGYTKIMLHYGGGSVIKSGLLAKVKESLEKKGISYVEFGGAQPNPRLSHAKAGIDICRKEGVQLILAVGGGSTIDSAKMMASGTLADCDPWLFVTKERVPMAALPIATILTLAASGSETSSSAVISNDESGLKRGFNSDFNRPLFSILSPELTFTLPPYQTACGIVDILMHTLERYITVPNFFEPTDSMAEAILKSVIAAGRVAMKEPENFEARATLMWAGSLSHIDLTGLGKEYFMISHQLEHEISGMFPHVAHGAGLAVVFPAWCRYVYQKNLPAFCRYANRVWDIPMDESNPEKNALAGIEATEKFFREIGMPLTLRECGIGEDAIEEMAEKCTFFGKRKLHSVVVCGKNEIMDIYKLCL